MKARNLLVLMFVMVFSFVTVAVSNQGVLAQEQPQQDKSAEIVHPIPQVPIVVDGVKMDPRDITKFNGQELYYLVNDDAKNQGVVFIFTTLQGIEKVTVLNEKTTSAYGCVDPTDIWTNVDFQGDYKTLSPWNGIGQGSFWNTSWDNNIESVHSSTCNYTKFYDSTSYSGSQLWLATNGWTSWLVPYGWDNRAGSWKIE